MEVQKKERERKRECVKKRSWTFAFDKLFPAKIKEFKNLQAVKNYVIISPTEYANIFLNYINTW